MKHLTLKEKIKELAPWYQNINIDGIVTNKGGPYSGNVSASTSWDSIMKCFPKDVKMNRVLDLGANAGYYSIMAAKLGASVIGIDREKSLFYNQYIFLKEYYEELWNKKLDITYIQSDISDVDYSKLGKFDCIFALAVLYHIGKHKYGKGSDKKNEEQLKILKILSKITNGFIIRTRKGNKYKSPEYYTEIFKELGFKLTNNIPQGKRILISFEKV